MAKTKVAVAKTQATLDRIESEVSLLATRMWTVECTAICVELALLHQNGEEDAEIARCVHRNIVDALSLLRKQAGEISRALGGKPQVD